MSSGIIREYQHLLLGGVSEDDKLAVVLSVKDWKAIAENLREDADAENEGPAVSQVMNLAIASGEETDGEDMTKAYEHDYKVTAAHECQAGTMRCVDTIEAALARYGWEV